PEQAELDGGEFFDDQGRPAGRARLDTLPDPGDVGGDPRHERRAVDGTGDASEPTDDDHGDEEERRVEVVALPGDDVAVVRLQGTGEAGQAAGDGEGHHLVPPDVDADHLGGDVLVAAGDQGPAEPGAEQVHPAPHDEGGDH